MKRFHLGLSISLASLCFVLLSLPVQASWWDFQAIDTMKYSRDTSGQYLRDMELGRQVAEEHVSAIAQTGATHVAIATPYDEQFLPVLRMWVETARRHKLKVWFRGNFSGWEEWFEYEPIDRAEHLQLTEAFLKNNLDLFQDGDVFTACPECENGGPGDPRHNGDEEGHRQFLIEEYKLTSKIFREAGLNVRSNFHSMNGDVAELIMDRATTNALGGVVVVDHYVESPEELNQDITELAEQSGGKVLLGEFGAPIPDIHGEFTEEEQAAWIEEALGILANNPHLVGINYWTGVGGSTALWKESGRPKRAVEVVTKYFSKLHYQGRVVDELGRPLSQVQIVSQRDTRYTDETGTFYIRSLNDDELFGFSKAGYQDQMLPYGDISAHETIVLQSLRPSLWFKLQLWFLNTFF